MFPTTLTRVFDGHVRRILIVALATLMMVGVLAIIPGAPLSADSAHAAVAPDPNYGSCDADILFILDTSGSMENVGLNAVEDGFTSFVEKINDSAASGGAPDSGIAAIHFSNTAATKFATYQNVLTQETALTNYVTGPNGDYWKFGHNWTNWQDAFDHANAISRTPDFVIFLTDGQPTRNNSMTAGTGNSQYQVHTDAAIPAATTLMNAVTGTDTVIGIGVGSGFGGDASKARLGSVVDDVIVTSFDNLATVLAEQINEICKPALEVTKTVTPDTLNEPGGTVTFTAAIENTSSHTEADIHLTSLSDTIYGTVPFTSATCALDSSPASPVNPYGTWIPYGDSMVCTWQNTFSESGDWPWTETDVVTAQGMDPSERPTAPDNDSAKVTIKDVPSSIEVTKTARAPASRPEPGGDFMFEVKVKNTSAVDTVTINSIIDDPYGSLTAINPAVKNSTCKVSQVLVPGQAYTCSFTVEILDAPGDYENTVTASGVDDDGVVVSDKDDATVTIKNVDPEIVVTKTADPTTVAEPGGSRGLHRQGGEHVTGRGRHDHVTRRQQVRNARRRRRLQDRHQSRRGRIV